MKLLIAIAGALALCACGSQGYMTHTQEVAKIHPTTDPTMTWVVVAETKKWKKPDINEHHTDTAHHIYLCIRETKGAAPVCYAPRWHPSTPIPALLEGWRRQRTK